MTASTRGVVHVAAGPGIAARRILAGLTGGFSPRTMGGSLGAVPAPAAPAQPGSAVPLAGSGYAVRQGAPGGVVDDGVVRQSTGAGYADSTQPRGASQPRPRSLRR